jgi:hypothetical protein
MKTAFQKLMTPAAAGLLLTSCASMQPLMSAPAVSMSRTSVAPGTKSQEIGPVSARYCRGDDATTGSGSTVGLLDEVIRKAETSSKASYIGQASFQYDGTCIELEGVAMR